MLEEINEKKFKTLEKERTNALEMAAQKNEKREKKKSSEIKLEYSRFSIYSERFINNPFF